MLWWLGTHEAIGVPLFLAQQVIKVAASLHHSSYFSGNCVTKSESHAHESHVGGLCGNQRPEAEGPGQATKMIWVLHLSPKSPPFKNIYHQEYFHGRTEPPCPLRSANDHVF